MYKLVGARKFIDMPKGTFYIPYWLDNKEKCLNLIEKYNEGNLTEEVIPWHNIEIYGDNYGSARITLNPEDDVDGTHIFYYDANVVGDASPGDTLYLIINEDELPETILVDGPMIYNEEGYYEYGKAHISKNQLLNIKYSFIIDYLENPSDLSNIINKENDWARNILNTEYKDDEIVNYGNI